MGKVQTPNYIFGVA